MSDITMLLLVGFGASILLEIGFHVRWRRRVKALDTENFRLDRVNTDLEIRLAGSQSAICPACGTCFSTDVGS